MTCYSGLYTEIYNKKKVTALPVGVKYGNTIMIIADRNFVLVLWIYNYEGSCCFFNSLYNSFLLTT